CFIRRDRFLSSRSSKVFRLRPLRTISPHLSSNTSFIMSPLFWQAARACMVLFVIWGEGGQLDRAKDMPTFHRRREHRSCTIYSVGREKVNCRAAAREAGLGHDSV